MEIAKFSPRLKSKSRLVCAVKDCESRSNKNLDIIFHRFPPEKKRLVTITNKLGNFEKIDVHSAWKKAVNIKQVNPSMKVCSRHFKIDDYILPNIPAKKRLLKKNAVPSNNLPEAPSVTDKSGDNRIKRRKNKRKITTEQDIPEEFEGSAAEDVYRAPPNLHDNPTCEDITIGASTSLRQYESSQKLEFPSVKQNILKDVFIKKESLEEETSTKLKVLDECSTKQEVLEGNSTVREAVEEIYIKQEISEETHIEPKVRNQEVWDKTPDECTLPIVSTKMVAEFPDRVSTRCLVIEVPEDVRASNEETPLSDGSCFEQFVRTLERDDLERKYIKSEKRCTAQAHKIKQLEQKVGQLYSVIEKLQKQKKP